MTRDGSSFPWIAAAAGTAVALMGACTLPTGGTGEGTTSTGPGGAGGEIGGGGSGGASTTTGPGGAGGTGGAGGGGPTCGAPWSMKLATTPAVGQAAGIAIDGSGDVLFAGSIVGAADIDGAMLDGGSGGDVLLVKRDQAGNALWARDFGSTDAGQLDYAAGVAVDGAGNVLLTGGAHAGIDFGGGPRLAQAGENGFLAKLNAAGDHTWSFGLRQAVGRAVAIDDANDILIAGWMTAALTLPDNGANVNLNFGGGSDAFVAKVNGNGNTFWGKSWGDGAQQRAFGVAARASSVYVTGEFEGTINLSGGSITSMNSYDAFLVRLRANGEYAWSKRLGGNNTQAGIAVAAGPDEAAVVAGNFKDAITLADTTTYSATAGAGDVFVAKYASDGTFAWSRQLGGGSEQYAKALFVDGDGRVFLTGSFKGTLDIDETHSLESGNKLNVFVVVLAGATGEHLYSWHFQTDGKDQAGTAIASDACRNVVLGGTFDGALDFGDGPLADGAGNETFLAKLRPSPPLP